MEKSFVLTVSEATLLSLYQLTCEAVIFDVYDPFNGGAKTQWYL